VSPAGQECPRAWRQAAARAEGNTQRVRRRRRRTYAGAPRPIGHPCATLPTLAAAFGVGRCHLHRPSLFPTEYRVGRDPGMPALASPRPVGPRARAQEHSLIRLPIAGSIASGVWGEALPVCLDAAAIASQATWWGQLPVIRHGPPVSARGMPRVVDHAGPAAVTREMGMCCGTRVD
jgi:hypothetical protein